MMKALLTIVLLFVGTAATEGRTIFVDSRSGHDSYDGTASEPLNAYVGPVRTLQRAMQLVDGGDTLVLVDNGTPYYGSMTFFGPRFSGTSGKPFQLLGNGAVISGTRPVDPSSWVELGNDLWRITPRRKGWYQLVENGQAVPHAEWTGGQGRAADLPAGSWGIYRGAVYYKGRAGDTPRLRNFELAVEQTGLTLLDVNHVIISDVTFRHFRIDGINAHDRCDSVRLVNVRCEENGRSGICVGGTSSIEVESSSMARNAKHSLLISELGEASVRQVEFDRPPTATGR